MFNARGLLYALAGASPESRAIDTAPGRVLDQCADSAKTTAGVFNRRGFLGALGLAIGGAALDPERALRVPGAKTISVPALDVLLPPIAVRGSIWLDADGNQIGYSYMAPLRKPLGGLVFHECVDLLRPCVGVDISLDPRSFSYGEANASKSIATSDWPADRRDEQLVRHSIATRLGVSPSRLKLA